jgi:hypothetical protein
VFNQNQLILNGRVSLAKWLSLFGYYSLNSAHGDTSGNGGFITTPGNIAADYGKTGFDVRSRIFMAGSVTLPHYILISPFLIGQTGNPYNVTVGNDLNGDTIFNDRPDLVNASLANPNTGNTIKTIPGCGTFAPPSLAPAGSSVVPINYCTGPGLFSLNLRLTKTFGFGPMRNATPSESSGRGGPGGGGPPGGGSGSHSHSSGGSGGPMMFGGGGSTGRRYNLSVGVSVNNLFNNTDLATPIGTLNSPKFGQSTQVTGGAYTGDSAIRRIQVQASFTF